MTLPIRREIFKGATTVAFGAALLLGCGEIVHFISKPAMAAPAPPTSAPANSCANSINSQGGQTGCTITNNGPVHNGPTYTGKVVKKVIIPPPDIIVNGDCNIVGNNNTINGDCNLKQPSIKFIEWQGYPDDGDTFTQELHFRVISQFSAQTFAIQAKADGIIGAGAAPDGSGSFEMYRSSECGDDCWHVQWRHPIGDYWIWVNTKTPTKINLAYDIR